MSLTQRRADARALSTVTLLAAILALVGNVAHPVFPAGPSAEEFLGLATTTTGWTPIHLTMILGVVLLVAAVGGVAHRLDGSAGAELARVSHPIVLIGGVAFTVAMTIDGVVKPLVAGTVAADPGATAELLGGMEVAQAIDLALLSLSIALLFGLGFLLFGAALVKARAFPAWIGSTLIGTGVAGSVVGTMMLLDVARPFTIVAMRFVGLSATVGVFALGVALRRWSPDGAGVTDEATATGPQLVSP